MNGLPSLQCWHAPCSVCISRSSPGYSHCPSAVRHDTPVVITLCVVDIVVVVSVDVAGVVSAPQPTVHNQHIHNTLYRWEVRTIAISKQGEIINLLKVFKLFCLANIYQNNIKYLSDVKCPFKCKSWLLNVTTTIKCKPWLSNVTTAIKSWQRLSNVQQLANVNGLSIHQWHQIWPSTVLPYMKLL